MSSKELFLAGVFIQNSKVRAGPRCGRLWFSTLPPAPLIGYDLCPPVLCWPALMEWGLGRSTSTQDGAVCLCEPSTPGCGSPKCFFFSLTKREKRWKRREGRQILSFFSDRVAQWRDKALWGRWSLTVFKLLCKKQNKQKKAACLIYCGREASPRLRVFPWSWEGGRRSGHVSCSL